MLNPNPSQENSLDFEKLVVFQKALALLRVLSRILSNPPRKMVPVIDHLDRALSSILLNIAEGQGKESGSRDRKRFYRTALGSAKEAGACLIILDARGFLPEAQQEKARGLLREVVAMLTVMAR
jgi:four helix bundle protein